MSNYIKCELCLIFKSKRWIGLACLYLLFMLLPIRQDFQLSVGGSSNLAQYMVITYQHSEIFIVLCTLVGLLFGDVLAKDFRNHIAILTYTRSGTLSYIFAKHMILICGVILFVLALNLIYAFILLPKAPLLTQNNDNIINNLSSGRLIQSAPATLFYFQLFIKKCLETIIYLYPCLLCSLFIQQKLLIYIQPILFHLFLNFIFLFNMIPYKWTIGGIFSLYNYIEVTSVEGRLFTRRPVEAIWIYLTIFLIFTCCSIGLNYYILRYRREELY